MSNPLAIFNDSELKLITSILKEIEGSMYFPRKECIFTALENLHQVKVVVLGQDPYHQPDQANGLAFAVNKQCSIPPSLRNIQKEVIMDMGQCLSDRTLLSWKEQGVCLLNSTLTVKANQPNSHYRLGWYQITNKVIHYLSEDTRPKVFLLWGKFAQEKETLIDANRHLILKAPHPSPLSASTGFFGCKHFSKTNTFLLNTHQTAINW